MRPRGHAHSLPSKPLARSSRKVKPPPAACLPKCSSKGDYEGVSCDSTGYKDRSAHSLGDYGERSVSHLPLEHPLSTAKGQSASLQWSHTSPRGLRGRASLGRAQFEAQARMQALSLSSVRGNGSKVPFIFVSCLSVSFFFFLTGKILTGGYARKAHRASCGTKKSESPPEVIVPGRGARR